MAFDASFDTQPSSPPLEVHSSPNPFDWHITSPRLYISHLNPSCPSHCALRVSLLHSPSSQKHNRDGPSMVPDAAAAQRNIAASVDRTIATGYGRYLVSLRTGGNDEHEKFSEKSESLEHVGVVSMQLGRFEDVQGPRVPDVGFNVLERWQGKGIANEAVRYLMRWFREERGVEVVAGMTDDENDKAKKAFTRLGFRCWGMRGVKGVVDGGKESSLSVWTIGVEDEGTLEGLGLGHSLG